MKAGNIVKISKKGLTRFGSIIRNRLRNEIGLVVETEYKFASKIIKDEKTYASMVRFPSQKDDIMLFPDEVEVIS